MPFRWILATFLGLVLLAPAGEAKAACQLSKLGEFPVTMRRFQPLIPAKINGVDGMFLADTGAFFSMLTPQGAAKFKLTVGAAPFNLTVTGVTGRANVGLAIARNFTVFGATIRDTQFLVAPHDMGGEDGVLGDNLLSLRDSEFDLANGVIRMWESKGCQNANLAYWATPGTIGSQVDIDPIAFPSNQILGWAKVNGVRIRVLFDTGASLSTLKLEAARRIGLTKNGTDLAAAGETAGVGNGEADTWFAPINNFDLGDEHVAHTHLRVGKIELDDADMLIGGDWFLSHHVYVANSQHKLYFTYNGGPVFYGDKVGVGSQPPPPAPPAPPAALAEGPTLPTDQPTDADGFARRGDAFLVRNDAPSAIADFSKAIELDPKNPRYFLDRAGARLRDHQAAQAMDDVDQALKLKPDDVTALIARGSLRLRAKDDAGANADFDAAIKADPKSNLPVAIAYGGARRYDDAIAHLDPWLAAYPKADGRAGALNSRCWWRAMLNRDLDKALDDCNEALRLSGGNVDFLDSRGMVYLRLGQLDRSIADYNAVLKREHVPWSYYGRGLAEEKKGLKAQSDADIAAALAINPKLPDEAKQFGLAP